MLCEENGCILKVIPINDAGEILMDEFEKLISSKTKFISIVHVLIIILNNTLELLRF